MSAPASRQSSGLALPSLWQWLMMIALCCAAYVYWPEASRRGDLPENSRRQEFVDKLRLVEDLVERGPESVPELVALLSSPDLTMRRFALVGLGRLGDHAADALELVRERLVDDDEEIRNNALRAFVEICRDPDDLVAVMVPLLANPDSRMRESAAKVLGGPFTTYPNGMQIGNSGESATARRRDLPNVIPSVIAMAGHEDPTTRGLVIRILDQRDVRHDDPAVTQALRGLVDDPDSGVRTAAIIAFTSRGVARADEIRVWLRDADPKVVAAALGAVEWLGPDGPLTLPELMALVDDEGNGLPQNLTGALGSLKTAAKPAVPGLMRRLGMAVGGAKRENGGSSSSTESAPQFWAVPALLEMGADPAELRPFVTPHISSEWPTNTEAARWLSKFDPEQARRQAVRMIRHLEEHEKSVTREILQVVVRLGPEARDAVPLFIGLIERGNPKEGWIEYYCVEGLGHIGPDAAPSVTCLTALLQRSKDEVYSENRDANVARSLGKIGPASQGAVPALLAVLDHPLPPPSIPNERGLNPQKQAYTPPFADVLGALGEIGDNSDQVLFRLRHHSESIGSMVRLAALDSLVKLDSDSKSVVSDLMQALSDESVFVRFLAASAGAWRADAPRAVEALTNTLKDTDPWVASAAALSLRDLGPDALPAVAMLREMSQDPRNAVFNGIRVRVRPYRGEDLILDKHDLAHLSAAQCARMALEAIE